MAKNGSALSELQLQERGKT